MKPNDIIRQKLRDRFVLNPPDHFSQLSRCMIPRIERLVGLYRKQLIEDILENIRDIDEKTHFHRYQ
jgi:hypothetical protein